MKHLFSFLMLLAFFSKYASAAFSPELLERATAGDPAAQYDLAMCYLKGDGIKKSSKDALKWFTTAAEAGHAEALYKVGLLYHEGNDIKKNPAKAVECFIKGTETGNQNCRNAYALCLSIGTGIEKDTIKAQKIWEELAEEGHIKATYNLGGMYYRNEDYTKAFPYLLKAVSLRLNIM